MNDERKKIYRLAEKTKKEWPRPLALALKKYWQKTLKDDEGGLISGFVLAILPLRPSAGQKDAAMHLGAASLYRWTAANLQDDLIDSRKIKKINLPLAKACWESAEALSATVPLSPLNRKLLQQISLKENGAIFSEIKRPKTIPPGILAPSAKSLFLLISPVHLSMRLNWEKSETQKLFKAGCYLLAAKQLADDLYDYREDWKNGRRNFAHRGLSRLPHKNELPSYYKEQAENILQLCACCRRITKTVSPLSRKNCFESPLKILEINCRRELAKINRREEPNHIRTKSQTHLQPPAIIAPVRNRR